MDAYPTNITNQGGEQSQSQSIFLGPAWLIACGVGAILGGIFMRGTSFSWPLMMLGGGVGLVGSAMLYRNVMRARRRNADLPAAFSGAGPGGGALPSAGLTLALTSTRLPPMIASGGRPVINPGRPLVGSSPLGFVVLLEKSAHCGPHIPASSGGTASNPVWSGKAEASPGRSCTRCRSRNGSCGRSCACSCCVVQSRWPGELGPFEDAIALAVPLPTPPHAPAEDSFSAAAGSQHVEQGRAPYGRDLEAGGSEQGSCQQAGCSQPVLKTRPSYEKGAEGAAVVATAAGGFALVLQPRPQLLGFSMQVLQEQQQQLFLPFEQPDENATASPVSRVFMQV
ncbi:hypothetical protein VaNZ11_009621 [Volvox africanus]|uniref:Transmembrane protein n=1 Tax=Volvox africanus TaxID=51714 RepID=A0ABQ5S7P8_9CHLO|nr:hypothetical protein VaNZ11_009621 [Volvox africanus]